MSEENKRMLIEDALGMFVYSLLHDIPAGKLDEMVRRSVAECDTGVSDSPLAKYAEYLANELRGAKVHNMTQKLTKLFGEEPDEESEDEDLEGPVFSRPSENEFENELELMRDEIEGAANNLDPEKDYEKLVEAAKQLGKHDEKNVELEQVMQKFTTLEDAENALVELQQKGLLTEEQVELVQNDIEEFKEKQDGRTSDTEE